MRVLLALYLVLSSIVMPGAHAKEAGAFAQVDAHAEKAPPSAEKSVSALAKYLVRPARNDEEKARAIFRWITLNVSYDTARYQSGAPGAMSPEEVLHRRKAVCSGYAALFEHLAKEAGLEAVTIRGHSKGYPISASERQDSDLNHAWNAVKIDGKWRLLDCTWGAGHVTPSMKFVRKFSEHYFLTPPEEFLYGHFPLEPKWQLLDRPVARHEYERMVPLRPDFFRCGLALHSHRWASFEAEDSATVTLTGPEDALLLCNLMRDGKELGRSYTLTQREKGKIVTRVRFPRPGNYILRYFVKRRNESGPYSWALDYQITASRGAKERAEFPKTYGTFQESGAILEEPMVWRLKAGERQRFSLRVPGAAAVAVSVDGKWTHLQRTGDRFTGEVALRPGPVQLCASLDPAKRSYSVLLEYEAK
ncbi:MAG: hypothetical protein GX785_07285 [Armatimonadetes bacterium]|nr:hypothetical protein [Armatimonadota bacterium]